MNTIKDTSGIYTLSYVAYGLYINSVVTTLYACVCKV